MFKNAENLINYWHVIGFSKSLTNKPCRATLYSTPLVLWRDEAGSAHALLDYCLHRGAPLSMGQTSNDTIICPYHGWQFDHTGRCVHKPSSGPKACQASKQLTSFKLIEQDNLIWIWLNPQQKPLHKPHELSQYYKRGWQQTSYSETFYCNTDLLIENFMDSSHTAFVHAGLIRGIGDNPKARQITILSRSQSVLVSHEKVQEQVGWGSRLLFGKWPSVEHTDEFILPSIVKVDYSINSGQGRFMAFIFCSPVDESKTKAYILISYKFGLFNKIAAIALPKLIKKVVKQDLDITSLQQTNNDVFSKHTDLGPGFDEIHLPAYKLRQKAKRSTSILNELIEKQEKKRLITAYY